MAIHQCCTWVHLPVPTPSDTSQTSVTGRFSSEVADGFNRRSAMPSKIRWLIRIDPERKCVHVNLVKRTNVEGEQEYLFAPYSAFTVLSSTWSAGTTADPHVVELLAAVDNKDPTYPEDLPLAPWS